MQNRQPQNLTESFRGVQPANFGRERTRSPAAQARRLVLGRLAERRVHSASRSVSCDSLNVVRHSFAAKQTESTTAAAVELSQRFADTRAAAQFGESANPLDGPSVSKPRYSGRRSVNVWAWVILLLLLLCTVSSAGAQQGDFPSFDELMKRGSGTPGTDTRAPAGNAENDLPDSNRTLPPSTLPQRGDMIDPESRRKPEPFPILPGNDLDRMPLNPRIAPTDNGSSAGRLQFPDYPAEQPEGGNWEGEIVEDAPFNWVDHSTSVADLRLPRLPDSEHSVADVFEHGQAFLTGAEQSAYLDLVESIAKQRRLLLQQVVDELENKSRGKALWEKAFYQFETVRRLAWNNGHLRQPEGANNINGLPNPFTDPVADGNNSERYQLLEDIARFPKHFVGRPVVLYGRFRATSNVRIGMDNTGISTAIEFASEPLAKRELAVLRGSLVNFDSNLELATVDTRGLILPQKGLVENGNWPEGDATIPVLVKGWVVKQWNQRPLIYCEALRQISHIPHVEMIRQNTVDKRSVRDEETWLYYETLRQMELTSRKLQKQAAATIISQRIDHLMLELQNKAKSDVASWTQQVSAGKLSESNLQKRRSSLERQLNYRVARYRKLKQDPFEFPTYVDMFQYPEVYHGYPVTLHGHVSHIISYPGDDHLFNGRMLHELWLFTDDSQHNPAVIITPNLPREFPTDAGVVDRVSVTGCFFKRYVYESQDTDRIAPLLLAGNISWSPTVDQVVALVEDGSLSPQSTRAVQAMALSKKGMSRGAAMFLGCVVVLVLMILWGRSQREERDRVRLRKRVNEIPEFENPALPGYPLPLTEFHSDLLSD